MGSKPKSIKAPAMDIGKDLQQYVSGMSAVLPQMLDQEGKFRSEFQGLNLGDIQSFLSGVDGQQGLFGLGQDATRQVGQQLGTAREAELGQMTGQAGLTRGLMQAISPEQAEQINRMQSLASEAAQAEGGYASRMGQALGTYGITPQQFNPNVSQQNLGSTITQRGLLGSTLSQGGLINPTIQAAEQSSEAANRMAEEAFARRGTLSPEEQRIAQQSARESFGAAGRLGGNAAVASEIMNRNSALAGRRAEASAAGEQAFGQRQNLANLRFQEQQGLFGQQVGGRQLQTAEEQALFQQQMAGREQGLQQEQALFGQNATAAQQRLAQQQALFGQQIAGSQQTMGMQQAGLGQLQGIEEMRARLRESAGTEAGRAFSAAGNFYMQPGLQLLGSTPLSYQAGQQQLGLGLGAIGAGTPQLFDPSLGLNLGAAQRQNVLSAASANAQAKSAYNSGIASMVGNIAGSAGQMAMMKSDRRVKTNIKVVGKTFSGLPVYTYKYKGQDTTQMGVMAQDVEIVNPEAVAEFNGIKHVDYNKI